MRWVSEAQADQEITGYVNVMFTKENLHITGREPTREELNQNYWKYNRLVHAYSVVRKEDVVLPKKE